MIQEIKQDGQLLALIIPAKFDKPGISFFTPDDLTQQIAHMRHPAGKVIVPHVHNPVPRTVQFTMEVIFIKRGKMRVDFFTNEQVYLESRVLQAGDTVLLATGGHGFEMLDECEFIEVKQGPYAGDKDKTRFLPPAPDQIIIKS
jgi:mannose-6-phosphate isomerase-like protein (cupin superfamily)